MTPMKMYLNFVSTLLVFLLALSTSFAFAHPQDENIVMDIEMGQLQLQTDQMDAEYQAALKRQVQRKRAAMSLPEKFWLYAKAGVEHIIPKGLDHILFILGLFFSTLALTSLLWQVTAFTLAHSVTLGLAVLGVIPIQPAIIEPLIALSIVWIAVENCVFRQSGRWRPMVVFAFGLLHGLGFASVLNEYGLPKQDLLASLLAFNVGVEVAQIGILLIAALLVYALTHVVYPLTLKNGYRAYLQVPTSLGIALIGGYWLIERTVI